ncbi:MAG: redoxin domain-containing protein, partial [Gemmatimonadetes bacterium]|nr:redoxin domain-containing protein [Gemmatimonadota bacterium]
QRNTYTDVSGLFTLNDVAGGHIWVNHPEIRIVNQEIIPADDVIDIRVERLRLYSVSGVMSLNEGSVEGLEISIISTKRPSTSGPARSKRDFIDATGAYRFDDLEPGEYIISIRASEELEMGERRVIIYRTIQSRRLVIEDRDVTLNFEPLGDARITGVATYKGQPVSGVYVNSRVLADDPQKTISTGGTQTDKEGRFELRNLPSARIEIRFFSNPRSGKRWSKVDTLDLMNKKELRYLTELKMEERPTLSLGDIAPEFEAKRLDGSTFRLADYRGKKAVLIDFWATWCAPCVDEIPTIKRIAETYRNQGLEVVGISLDREEKALRDFVKREKLSYVQVFEKEKARTITKSYGVWGIPSVFLIDKNGVINALKLRGTRTEAAVRALLATDLQTADGNSR